VDVVTQPLEVLFLKHQFAEINGLRFHYVINGSGRTMLFLHGFPEFWYEWRNLLVEFGKDYQAIAPDLRGYNLSEKPPNVSDYSVRHLVADIRGFFEHFSPGEKGILVAHDWGGAVAWAFAMAHPEYLERLIIINAPHPAVFARELFTNPRQQKASAYMLMFRSESAEELLSRNNYLGLQRAVFESSTRPELFTEEDRAQYLAAWSQPGALTGGLNYYRASRIGPPTGEEQPTPFSGDKSFEVRVPTLVIWGDQDTALLEGNLEGLEQYVPQLTIRRIANGSHWVIHEETQQVCNFIRDFLKY
jgi:pimeloyl-ACP methyl ester carboxylesterase